MAQQNWFEARGSGSAQRKAKEGVGRINIVDGNNWFERSARAARGWLTSPGNMRKVAVYLSAAPLAGYALNRAIDQNEEQKKKYPAKPVKQLTAGDFGGSKSGEYSGPSQRELRRYYDLQARSKYQPRINQLGRQIENANAMGIQSQAAIGGWGQEAGREIARAGRRNMQDVTGIQNNMAGGLSAIGAAAGNLGTTASNRSFLNGAAGAAGLIAGLGAADQGWFNRARDVNAQTTNFYRNNARDQYAQQAYDLQQSRNDATQALADAQMAGATKAKTDYVAARQQQAQTPQDRADLLTSAKIQARQAIAGKTSVAEARALAVDSVADPQMKAEVYNYITRLYAGPRNSTQWKRVQSLRKQAEAGN